MIGRYARAQCLTIAAASAIAFATGCSSQASEPPVDVHVVHRAHFLGAFFRASGTPPFGVFSVYSKQEAPEPYPAPSSTLFGAHGYCDEVAANGLSISTGYLVDKAKIRNIVDLGVKWTRTSPSAFFDDTSHIFDHYSFGDFDSAQCALARAGIVPTIGIDPGPVQYDAVEGQFSPKSRPIYPTAADFGTWCGAVVRHETQIFTAVRRYTLPGNEVNSNDVGFPGGDAQIASYAQACYHAVKRVQPSAFVYGFELNMDARADPVGFVQRMYDAGCKQGTCYDGLSLHLSLRYPIATSGGSCRDGSVGCIAEIQAAAHAPVHVLIGETVYVIPANVPDENVKATAIVAAMKAFAAQPDVDGVNYANVDECDLYPSGYFVNGCLVDSLGKKLAGYTALQALAKSAFR